LRKIQKACKKTEGAAENAVKCVGEMAMKITTAIKSNTSPLTPEKAVSSAISISPVRKIDMQGKLLQQLELIHSMLE